MGVSTSQILAPRADESDGEEIPELSKASSSAEKEFQGWLGEM